MEAELDNELEAVVDPVVEILVLPVVVITVVSGGSVVTGAVVDVRTRFG